MEDQFRVEEHQLQLSKAAGGGGGDRGVLYGEIPPRGPTPCPCTGLEVNFLARLQSFASKNFFH